MQIDDLIGSYFCFYLNYFIYILLKKETMMVFDLLLGNFQSSFTINFTVE